MKTEGTMNKHKESLIAYLSNTWHWYLLSMLFVIIIWNFIFGLLDKIPYEEQMNLFVATHKVNKPEIENQIYNILEDKDILQVNVDKCVPGNTETFYSVLFTRGITHTDILILPEGTWPDAKFQEYVLSFTEEELQSLLPPGNYEYLRHGNSIYGICVYNGKTRKSLLPDTWIDYDMDVENRNYYLFINAKSENIKDENTQVFFLLNKLLTR